MKELEIEFKNLLTQQEFEQIIEHFNMNTFFQQTNHYFDTIENDIKNKVGALRVREKGNTYTLTLKCPQAIGLLEINQTISLAEFQNLKDNHLLPNGIVLEELTKYNLEQTPIYNEVSLTTNRCEIEYKDGLLVLDHSTYLDTEDYELEYEVKDYEIGLQIFNELLKEMNIPQRKTPSKIKRAFNRLLELGK